MMQTLIDLQYQWLKKTYPKSPDLLTEASYTGHSKLDLLGHELTKKLHGKTVIDFGCGTGGQAVEMARGGASRVIGIDLQENLLGIARRRAAEAGVAESCVFATTTSEPAEVIVSLDAFEHFEKPNEILQIMSQLLNSGGELLFSFGPTWYHPLGGHLLSVFPWSHVVLSETALCRWRSTFKSDNATRFSEVAGGLNRMTIGRFERTVKQSDFRLATLECMPIRQLKPVHNSWTREFTTAVVRGRLVKK
jgi:SAM-dependent methyltransferase